ncbi:MAG TPA: cysteine hydrolase family protein [Roseiflexaceae bacterium]|nr:cysteine hydrolase family protein [Roseiflexaceae bacterium]
MHTTTALLVIDVQVGLIEGASPVYRADSILERIASLIDAARVAGTLVIYAQDKDVGGVGTPEWQIHPAVAPALGEPVVRKAWSDSFRETELAEELGRRAVTHLVIAGMKTNFCIDMTCRRAIALGYDVTLAADAHTTTDNFVLTAAQTIAYHNALLDEFGAEDGFGDGKHWITVRPSSEIAF